MNWEFLVFAGLAAFCVLVCLIREWLLWQGPRHWMRLHFPDQVLRTPIYGPADPYGRTNGPNARPNVRVAR